MTTVSALSIDDYDDITAWLNALLDQDAAGDDIPERVASLSASLEVACQDTSAELERAVDEITRGVPRLTYDLHVLRDGATALNNILRSVEKNAEPGMSSTLDRLHHLDTAKKNMEAAREVLREAESWSTLEGDVVAALAESQYEKAANRLAETGASLGVFEDTPEFEARRTLLISLQNQLEAALSTALVAAIGARDMNACRSFFQIFRNIQRESEFSNYYNASRRAALVESWKYGVEDLKGFPTFLSRFLEDFLSVLNEERTHMPAIYPDPQNRMVAFVRATMDALTPSLAEQLSALSDHEGSNAITTLSSVYQGVIQFGLAVDKIMEKVSYASSPIASPEVRPQHARRLSKRMSISTRSALHGLTNVQEAMTTWSQPLFEPFLDFQADYASLEQRKLDVGLDLALTDSDELRQWSVDVLSLADDSLDRCVQFTLAFGAVALQEILIRLLSDFLQRAKQRLVVPQRASGSSVERMEDYSAQDWKTIQHGLHLLEATKALRERLVSFDSRVRTVLGPRGLTIKSAQRDPIDGRSLDGVSRGAFQALQQSTLNSVALHSLFDAFESPTPPQSSTSSIPRAPLVFLHAAHTSIDEFARASQALLHDTLLSPLRKHLSTYAAQSVWTESPPSRAPSIPTFSRAPTSSIQRVGEGLLTLPQLFEVHVDDDALTFSLETLPHIDEKMLVTLLDLPPPPTPADRPTHTRRISISATALLTSPAPSPAPLALSQENVSSVWLTSLVLGIVARLTGSVLPAIRAMSTIGAAQLAADLSYLSNIVQALSIDAPAVLDRWMSLSAMTDAEGKQAINEGPVDDVLRSVARARGWIS